MMQRNLQTLCVKLSQRPPATHGILFYVFYTTTGEQGICPEGVALVGVISVGGSVPARFDS